VLLRPIKMDGDDVWYGLVAGGHRYEAAALLGWTHIDATIRDMTDAQALLSEIDENLVRRDLTPYERAIFINARLKAWAAVHPDRVNGNSENISELPAAPKRGRPKNSVKLTEFLGNTPPTMGFTAETAHDLGISASTVERALALVKGLSKPVHARISGTDLGRNGSLLRQIAGVADPVEQLRAVEALLDGDAKNFSQALHIASGRPPIAAPPRPADMSVKALEKLWKAAPPTHRKAMLHWLSGQSTPGYQVTPKGGAE
jgi:ParB family chromosome partitioning protein